MARILIVEDDELFSMAIATIIEDFGHAVTLAGHGKEATEKLLSGQVYDLIISDVQMPVMSGLALAEWVKKNKPTPLMLMTGFEPDINTMQAITLGADDLLFKPFKAEEARRAIDQCLAKQQQQPTARFCHIPVEVVRSGALDVNVYLRHGDQVVKILTRGELVDRNQIPALQNPEGCEFLTEMDNLEQLIAVQSLVISGAVKEPSIPFAEKIRQLKYAADLLREKGQAGLVVTDEKHVREFASAVEFLAAQKVSAPESLQMDLVYLTQLAGTLYHRAG